MALSDKNSIWYDSKLCTLPWTIVLKKHIAVISNKKLKMFSRIRACGFLVVAEEIQSKEMRKLKDAYELFRKTAKNEIHSTGSDSGKRIKSIVQKQYKSTDVRDMFLRNLPVVLVYGETSSFLIKRSRTINWEIFFYEINWPGKDRIVKQKIAAKMKDFLKPALKYASSSLNRHLLKTVILNLTSKTFMASGELDFKFDDSSDLAASETNSSLLKINKLQKTSYLQNKAKKEFSLRLEGSGRPSFAAMYPELSTYMLAIFYEEANGLHSHLLIWDTFFLWINLDG